MIIWRKNSVPCLKYVVFLSRPEMGWGHGLHELSLWLLKSSLVRNSGYQVYTCSLCDTLEVSRVSRLYHCMISFLLILSQCMTLSCWPCHNLSPKPVCKMLYILINLLDVVHLCVRPPIPRILSSSFSHPCLPLDTSSFETLIYGGLSYLVFSGLYLFSFLFVVEAIG